MVFKQEKYKMVFSNLNKLLKIPIYKLLKSNFSNPKVKHLHKNLMTLVAYN